MDYKKHYNTLIVRAGKRCLEEYTENHHIIPKCIVINDIFDMIFIKGKNPYLIHPEGEITQNVFKNIHNGLSMELRAALHTCKKEETVVKTTFHRIKINDEEKFVRLIVTPLDNALTNDLYLVAFQEEDSENLRSYDILETVNNSNEEVERLNLELARTREHLQTVVEELETSNEEMQSLNEELQSSNEELQSSNEELETTNEELQSTNEELQTAYTEMRSMFEERDNDAQRMSTVKNEVENSNANRKLTLGAADGYVIDSNSGHLNESDKTYVSWNWKMGGLADAKVITGVSGGVTTTSEKKFGTASLSMQGGSNSRHYKIDDHPDWDFGTGDFTIELWIRQASNPSAYDGIISFADSYQTSKGFGIGYNSNAHIYFTSHLGDAVSVVAHDAVLSNNTFHHIAVSRSSGTTKLFINGTEEDSATDNNSYITTPNGGYGIALGRYYPNRDEKYFSLTWKTKLIKKM